MKAILSESEIEIRPGTPGDADAAQRLYQAHLHWINVWFQPEDVVQRQAPIELIRTLFKEQPSAICEVDGVIVGFATTQVREIGVIEILHLYVDDPYRDCGIGTRLLECLETQVTNAGFHTALASASGRYYPGKLLPESLFRRSGFEVHVLDPDTHLYLKRLKVTGVEVSEMPVRHVTSEAVTDVSDNVLLLQRSIPAS